MTGRRCRSVLAGCVLGALTCVGASCKNLEKGPGPRARPVRDESILLEISRLGLDPDYVYSSEDEVAIQVTIDPALADPFLVRSYELWALGDEWEQVASVDRRELPFRYRAPGEGRHGLRVSVTLKDGRSALVPAAGDPPQVWYCVDRSPPRIEFTNAHKRQVFGSLPTLELAWEADEAQFGKEPFVLEWSGDAGASWRPISRVPAKPGPGRYSWKLPPVAQGIVQVRLRGEDLSGHAGGTAIDLDLSGRDGALLATSGLSERRGEGGEPPELVSDVSASDGEGAAGAGVSGARVAGGAGAGGAGAGGAGAGAVVAGAAAVGDEAPVQLVEPDSLCWRGGEELELRWELAASLTPQQRTGAVIVEYVLDADDEWKLAVEAPIDSGLATWTLPEISADACRLRILAEEVGSISELPVTLAIDSTPPTLRVQSVPAVAGQRLPLVLAVEDGTCSTVSAVSVWLRRRGESFWNLLEPTRVELEVGGDGLARLGLDLRGLEETEHEIYLTASDAAGNRGADPSPASSPFGSFSLDASPPRLALREPAFAWVGGFEGSLPVELDVADCAGPLVIEGRHGGGDWAEILRLESLAATDRPIEFAVPGEVDSLEIRATVRDAVGNEAAAFLGPRAVAAPLRLTSFQSDDSYFAFSEEAITWELEPSAVLRLDELSLRLLHEVRPVGSSEGRWTPVDERAFAGTIRPTEAISWVLPPADENWHRLRVELLRDGEAIARSESRAFRVLDFRPDAESLAAQESQAAFDAAMGAALRFRSLREEPEPGDPAALAARQQELAETSASARAGLERALTLDPDNYSASYELSRLLFDIDPERHYAEIVELFDRTIAKHPDPAYPLIDLGVFHITMGEYDKAVRALERSLDEKDTPKAHYNLGVALLYGQPSRPAVAREHFDKVLSSGDAASVGEASFYMAYCHLSSGDVAAARAVYDERKESMPSDLRTLLEAELR